MVLKAEFWHNQGMPNRAEKNAAIPAAVLSPAHPEPALPIDDRSLTERDRAASEGVPSGEIGGPTGPEPTRFGDWEKKGRCIDF